MRPAQDASAGQPTPTPIYDALCAEYRRSFRALPGDRSGEEDNVIPSFGTGEHSGSWDTSGWQYRGKLPALPPGQRDNRDRGL